MRLLASFVRQYTWQCAIVFVCLLFASLGEGVGLSTLLPLLSLATTNDGGAGVLGDSNVAKLLESTLATINLEPTLGGMVALIIVALLVKAGLTLLAARQVGYTVAHIATDLRLALLRALGVSRWEYFLTQRSGGLANSVATEANRSAGAFQGAANLTALLTQSLIFLGVALLVEWQAALLALAVGIFLFLALRAFVGVSRRAGRKQNTLFQSLLSLLTDSLRSIKPLKAMARETEIDGLLRRDTRKLNKAMRKEVLSREGLKATQELLIGIFLLLGIYVSLEYWGLELPSVMVLAIVLSRMLTKISKVQQEYQKLVVSESFYWSLLGSIDAARAEQELPFGDRQPSLERSVSFRGVGFRYHGQAVLEDFDLEIPAGAVTALIGPSGAGKTTAVDLLIGLLRADHGQLSIDGVSIEQIDIRAWRGLIGYVPQETVLLHDTILNNITIGHPALTEADAEWALKKAGAWVFVQGLSQGIHTVVGEQGSRFSGGQRQRIVIARALVHKPRLLILDEATSALDPVTEKAVSDTLRGLGDDYTILSVSHRAALTALADRVYRIENGRAVELGHADPALRGIA